MEKPCAYCQTLFEAVNPRKLYCQQHCADLACQERQREKLKPQTCALEGCEKTFLSAKKIQRFCSKACSAKWRNSLPAAKDNARRMQKFGVQARIGKKNPAVSARMKANNPMSNHETVEKFRNAVTGRTWLGQRGGNGILTEPQKLLAERLDLPMEYSIPTNPVKHLFQSLPNGYSVDLACPEVKLAIEVDGNSHKTKRWKFLDRRKTEVLNALGWSVIRYWNKEVLNDTERVVEEICLAIALRLQPITETTPTDASAAAIPAPVVASEETAQTEKPLVELIAGGIVLVYENRKITNLTGVISALTGRRYTVSGARRLLQTRKIDHVVKIAGEKFFDLAEIEALNERAS